jgi:hypothetical protein
MTHTTTPAEIHPQAPRTSNSRASYGKPPLQWISLYWIMLSEDVEEPIPLGGGTIASERLGYFEQHT